MPRWGLNHALHHAPYCFYLANSRLSSRAPSWRGGGQSRHCVRNTSAGTGVTNAELCEAVANHREGLGRRSLWRRDQAVNVKVGGVPFRCRPMTPSALVKGKPPVAMSDNLTHGQAPIGCDRTTRRLERNRKFVDSPLEGDGFELPVREHRAMAPSHGFAAATHKAALCGPRLPWRDRVPRRSGVPRGPQTRCGPPGGTSKAFALLPLSAIAHVNGGSK
jgi:hypothetical protein